MQHYKDGDFPTKMFIDRAHLAGGGVFELYSFECKIVGKNTSQNNDKDGDNFNTYQPVIFELKL